jgi:hypothetical protein
MNEQLVFSSGPPPFFEPRRQSQFALPVRWEALAVAIGTSSARLRPSDSGAVSLRLVGAPVFALAAAAHAISTVLYVHRASQGSLLLVLEERQSSRKQAVLTLPFVLSSKLGSRGAHGARPSRARTPAAGAGSNRAEQRDHIVPPIRSLHQRSEQ